MEINKLLNASPQGSEVDGDATDAAIHTTDNGSKRKHITTTPVIVAEATTRDTRDTELHTTESQDSNNNDGRSTETPSKKRKIDHAIQQEAEEEMIREAPLSLPIYSLAHRGRLSARSDIIPYTRELNHEATVTAITGEEDGVFICRINVQIANTADSCTGFCKIPVAGMDSGLADWYRTRPDLAEDLELEEVCVPGTFSGLVRLGRVVDENYMPGTYTCEAEFGLFGGVNPWVAELYVLKKHVPDYKLVDWEGEQNAVPSIETSDEKPSMHEHETYQRHTVLFSRYIEDHQEQMSITI